MNPMFWKKVQGQKHPGRWGIVEHQIPCIKVLFKTNTKGHKHPSTRLLSKSKTQLVNQRKQKVAVSPGTAHSPEIQSYWWTWWGAASPILNDSPVVCIYTKWNRLCTLALIISILSQREDTLTRDNRLCANLKKWPCMILFPTRDVVAKQRCVKQTLVHANNLIFGR